MKRFAIDFKLPSGTPSFALIVADNKEDAKKSFLSGLEHIPYFSEKNIVDVKEITEEEYKKLILFGVKQKAITTKL